MKTLANFLKTTALGGVVFLIPLVAVVAIIGKAMSLVSVFAEGLDRLIPFDVVAGLALRDILALGIVLAATLLAGIVAKSALFAGAAAKLDDLLMQLIPGYSWVKGITGSISDSDAESTLKPVLAKLDDQTLIGFEIERTPDDLVVLYLPGAPDPRSGTVAYMTADRITRLDTSFAAVARTMKSLGRGSSQILDS